VYLVSNELLSVLSAINSCCLIGHCLLYSTTEGEYCQPEESVQMPKQGTEEFSSGELQSADRLDADQQSTPSSGVKKSSQHRPVIGGRVTSTLDSSARFRRTPFSPTG